MALETDNHIWVLCDTGVGFQPLSFFVNLTSPATPVEVPEGYQHWLQIFSDNWGIDLDVFYPRPRPKPGKIIKVIIQCPFCGRSEVTWKHGEWGLFAVEVLPHLEEDCWREDGLATRVAGDAEPPALPWLKHTPEDYRAIASQYRKALADRLRHLQLIQEHQPLVERAESLLSSDSWLDTALGLMALTGRRVIEILKTGSFEVLPDSQANVGFSGHVKARYSSKARPSPHQIPVLTSPTLVVDAWRRLRQTKRFEALDSPAVYNQTATRLGEACRRYFSDWVPNSALKELRSLYALIACGLHCPPNMDSTCYISKVLGHCELDLNTAISYGGFYLVSLEKPRQRRLRPCDRRQECP